jgi:hypothetical protein
MIPYILRPTTLVALLLILQAGFQRMTKPPFDRPYMLAYIYLTDGDQMLPMGTFNCIHDIRDSACAVYGLNADPLHLDSWYRQLDTRLTMDDLPHIRASGSATTRQGYGRMPIFPGCKYSCVAYHSSSNYELRYFGMRFSRHIADSISFEVKLDFKE